MWQLAIRNVMRHRVRTAMTVAAIAFGVAGLILAGGFVADVFRQLGEAVIHSQFGHLQVARQGYFEAGVRSPAKYLIDDYQAERDRVQQLAKADFVAARLSFSGLLNNGKADWSIQGEGVEPALEAKLGTSLRIVQGRAIGASDPHGVMVGEGVAEALQLKPGDEVVLLANTLDGALNTLDLKVVGVFRSFSRDYDARTIRVQLADAQALIGRDSANLLVVGLRHTHRTEEALAAVQGGIGQAAGGQKSAAGALEVRPWQVLSDFYAKAVALYDRQFGVLILIVLLLVLLSVANTVNVAAMERMGEFGTMRALGDPPKRLMMLMFKESIILGGAGSLVGVVAGILAAQVISGMGIPMPPPPNANQGYIAQILVVPAMVLGAFAVGFFGTVLATVLPALRSCKMPVVDALRRAI